jgi:signal transduction histidine kinase
MLREPLGDPTFRLRFWDAEAEAWDGPLDPAPRDAVTFVERDGRPAVALVHDAQLEDDPELLQAAGAVALLAAENAELDGGWHRALEELRRSRARLGHAVDDERRRVAVGLHDGLQQRLAAIRLRVALAAELVPDPDVRGQLDRIGESLEEAIEEVRDVSHGLYPRLLIEHGLVAALEHTIAPVPVRHDGIARHSPEIESAVYYCCLEAVQNALKHGGAGVTVRVSLFEDADALRFEVADDGAGVDLSTVREGMGLQNLQDRVGALEGLLSVTSAPGQGTLVAGSVPLRARPA